MLREFVLHHAWYHRHAVLPALAVADRDLARREVDVPDSQAAAFQQSKARPVEQECHQARHTIQPPEDHADFVARENDGQVLRAFGTDQVVKPWQLYAEDLAIEEEQRVEGLILRGGSYSVTNGERRQEGRDFRRAHLGRMALAMEEDVALDPVDVRLFGPTAVVACTNRVTDPVEELRLWRLRRPGFAKEGRGRRALGDDSISDRPHRGASLHCSLRVDRR